MPLKERERKACLFSQSLLLVLSLHCLPGEMEPLARYFLLVARNRRVTKSVGCRKRAKPGGERWLGGERRLRSRDAGKDNRIHLVLIRRSGKQMSAVREMGGRVGGCRRSRGIQRGDWEDILSIACPIRPPCFFCK